MDVKKVRCITINTDASFHPKYKCGGYAFLIKSDLFEIKMGGAFKNNPTTPTDAEIKGIGNSIHVLLHLQDLPECDLLVINNDCKSGMQWLETPIYKTPKKIRRMIDALLVRLGNPKFEFRHVKAHNGTPDARSFVNNWCDVEAKKWMRTKIPKKGKC